MAATLHKILVAFNYMRLLVPLAIKNLVASAGCLFWTFVALVYCHCYVGPCCFSWLSLLHETFVTSVGCLCYMRPLSLQLLNYATCDLSLFYYVRSRLPPLYVGPMSSLDYVSFRPNSKENNLSKGPINRPTLETLGYNFQSCRPKIRRQGKLRWCWEVTKAWKLAGKKTSIECSSIKGFSYILEVIRTKQISWYLQVRTFKAVENSHVHHVS